jgi:hypothetical protein
VQADALRRERLERGARGGRQRAHGRRHAVHGAELVELAARHDHLDIQARLADRELELDHAVGTLADDPDPFRARVPRGFGKGRCGGRLHGVTFSLTPGHPQRVCHRRGKSLKFSIILGNTLTGDAVGRVDPGHIGARSGASWASCCVAA